MVHVSLNYLLSKENMKFKIFSVIFILSVGFGSCSYIREDRPDEGAEYVDAQLSISALIRKYKYPVEDHYVTTKDGYTLTVHRIPYGRLCPKEKNKGPVIVQHGLISASHFFLLAGTKRGLGYILADSCYDVWMPNSRGNSVSMSHIRYTPKQKKFWDFSFHEMGIYDIPAVIDYILNTTAAADVAYIGHSQGVTSFLIFSSLCPEYNDKVRVAMLLAPVVYLKFSTSPSLQLWGLSYPLIRSQLNLFRIYSLMQQDSYLARLQETFCGLFRPFNSLICQRFGILFYGYNLNQANQTFYQIFHQMQFYGSSAKQFYHYAQFVRSNLFRQYDYEWRNRDIYGQSSPPEYNLSSIKTNLHIFYSQNDALVPISGLQKLFGQLRTLRETYLVPTKNFNHMDHLFAKDIIDLEYDHLMKQLDSYYK